MPVAAAVEHDDPATPLQLAESAMAAGNVDGAVAHLSAAVRALTAAGDNRRAAMTCASLGDVFANVLGNKVAARPWFTRAMRLLEQEPPCVEQGYAAVAAMGCDVDDPAVLVERAALALDRARRFGDVDLETKALADGGLAHVQAGRVAEGMVAGRPRGGHAGGSLAPADRLGRAAHPAGPPRRGGGPPAGEGRPHPGAAAQRAPAPGPQGLRPGDRHRTPRPAGHGRRPGAGRGAARRARRSRAGTR